MRSGLQVSDISDNDEPEEERSVRHVKGRATRRADVAQHTGSASSSSYSDSESGDDADDTSSSDHEQGGSELPFGELEKLRQDGSTSASAMRARARALQGKKSFKREGKHRPMEMSSKKPVPIFRDTLQASKREVRDPRFESLSGKYTDDKFKKQYSFLFDERLQQEKKDIKSALQKVKSAAKREELKAQLAQIEQQLRNEEARRKKEAFNKQVKSKEKEAVAGGKRPFYLKKSEKKKLELVAKYEALKASGGLEKYMAKRRKKNAAKDHRYLPMGRRDQSDQGGS